MAAALPLVLLHGIRLTHTMWHEHVAKLTSQRRVVPIDLPGHGERAGQRFTMEAAADAVADTIASIGGRAIVAGISLGGYSAIAAAQRHPDAVAGVVAFSCTALPHPQRATRYRMLAKLAGRRGEFVQRGLLRLRLGAESASAVTAGGLHTAAVPDVITAVTGFDVLHALRTYPHKVWFINGARDSFRVDEETFVESSRDAKLVTVPRAGHLLTLTHGEVTSRLIEDAAREIDAAEPSAASWGN